MSRLFITQREIDFINDLAREVMVDIAGQTVFYYSISVAKSKIHDVYDEAVQKIFENPIELPAFVNWQESEVNASQFGIEQKRTIEVYVSARDLIVKNISVHEGDFVGYGTQFFEIVQATTQRSIYGQVEYSDGIKMTCKEARQSLFAEKVLGPKGEEYSDSDATKKTFVQSRGFPENIEGETGDVRDLQRKGVLDPPIAGPAEVSERGGGHDDSSFYDES